MALRDFLKSLSGRTTPSSFEQKAQTYANYQQQNFKGNFAPSYDRLAVMTSRDDLRVWLAERLQPEVEKNAYVYNDQASVDVATGSKIVIIDATPAAHARLHDKYDQVLRIKKSMGKKGDLYCAIGHRRDYKRFPRGTYPHLVYFCLAEEDLMHREADLTVDGAETIEGPRLYNFADVAEVIVAQINGPLARM